MPEVRERTFELSDLELPKFLGRSVLQKCSFIGCHFGATANSPAERRVIRDVQVIDCKTSGNTSIGPVIVEDVDVCGLRTGGVFISWGAVFKHVRIRGKCGKPMLNLPDARRA